MIDTVFVLLHAAAVRFKTDKAWVQNIECTITWNHTILESSKILLLENIFLWVLTAQPSNSNDNLFIGYIRDIQKS